MSKHGIPKHDRSHKDWEWVRRIDNKHVLWRCKVVVGGVRCTKEKTTRSRKD